MKKKRYIVMVCTLVSLIFSATRAEASSLSQTDSPPEVPADQEEATEGFDVRSFILHHLADSYEWQIVSNGKKRLSIPLPVILYSRQSGWHLFLSSRFQNGTAAYRGFHIAEEGKYEGKIVESDNTQNVTRPLDFSLTRNAASLLISSLLLILIITGIARILEREPLKGKKGFAGMMEMFILHIIDTVIKPTVGKDYRRYAPFLLTIFFFIFFNNLLGILPFFPGGANVTGNIAVTMVLAVASFLMINLTGTKTYYRDIFWPDVPLFLKVPFPLMPLIEIVGLFTKPFALMIRLFANIMAGHAIVLGLISIIFITASMGAAINRSMTAISVLFTIFIDFVELLVAYIQAYVFTLLSAVFIGMARVREPEPNTKTIQPYQ